MSSEQKSTTSISSKNSLRSLILKTDLIFFIFFFIALFFAYGMSLWDDDYGIWFSNIFGKSFSDVLLKIISPVSLQAHNWAFNERPLQDLFYFFTYQGFGYSAMPLAIFKSVFLALICVSIFLWLKVIFETSSLVATLSCLLFVSIPGTIAAHILFQDFAPLAEAALSFTLLYAFIKLKEQPQGMAAFKTWLPLVLMVYFGSKIKGDLKLVPIMLGLYFLITSRRNLLRYVPFLIAMVLVGIPWGKGLFDKAPPFVPGGKTTVDWMFNPPSGRSVLEYIWSSQPFNADYLLHQPNLSLNMIFGPFFWSALILSFFIFGKPIYQILKNKSKPLALIISWALVILMSMSVLAELHYFFRVRYSILTALPFSILSGFLLHAVFSLRKWWLSSLVSLALAAQLYINFSRVVDYRQYTGEFLSTVDFAYRRVEASFPNLKVVTYFDFLPYAFKIDAKNIREKTITQNADEFNATADPQNPQVILSLSPLFRKDMVYVDHSDGCNQNDPFVKIFGCKRQTRTYVSLRVPEDPDLALAEQAWVNGDLQAAKQKYINVLQRQPNNYTALHGLAITAFRTSDLLLAQRGYERLVEIDNQKMDYLTGLKEVYSALKLTHEMERLEKMIQERH